MKIANYYEIPAQNLIDVIAGLNAVIRSYEKRGAEHLTVQETEQLTNLRRERKNAKTAFTRRKIQMSMFEIIGS